MPYVSGNINTYHSRLHKNPTGIRDLSLYYLEATNNRYTGIFTQLLESYWSMDNPSNMQYDYYAKHPLQSYSGVDYVTGLMDSGVWFQGNISTGQYLSYSGDGLLLGASGFTWSIWATINNTTTHKQTFFGKWNDSTNAGPRNYVLHYLGNATNRIRFNFSGTSGETGVQTSVGPAFGSWMNIVCVHNAVQDSLSIYRNGSLDNTMNNVGIPIENPQEFRVGGDYGGRYLSGYVDELAFWKRPLASSEINYLYNNGIGRKPIRQEFSVNMKNKLNKEFIKKGEILNFPTGRPTIFP